MSSRRIVLLLVEGESDATLLTPSFNALFPTLNMPHQTHGEPLRCDVTTVSLYPDDARFTGLDPRDNAPTMVRKTVRERIARADYAKADVACVVQLIDLDGAFIPSDCIIEDRNCERIVYGEHDITVHDKSQRLQLCAHKRRNVNALRGMTEIMNVPYRLFYVSRNLEHAFADLRGTVSTTRKNQTAARLAATFVRDPDIFKDILTRLYALHRNEAGTAEVSWKTSWDDVMKHGSLLSLHRGSNLLFLPGFVREISE